MTTFETFPKVRTCPFAPPPTYTRIREEEPVSQVRLPDGGLAWVVSRHEDVRMVLNDRRFSADRRNPHFPELVEGAAATKRPAEEPTLLSMDGAQHSVARKTVLGEFTLRRTEALRGRVQEIVDRQIESILAGPQPADLVQELSLPVPSLVICELLGVPYSAHAFFQQHSTVLIARGTPSQERDAAAAALLGYMNDLIAEKEIDPPDDLLGRQIRTQREKGSYRRAALVGMGFLLLVAGHETTANMISLSTVAFLRDPEQLALVRADPSRTLAAVEEMLRYFTILDAATARLCVEDVEVNGQLIRAGDGVLALTYSANRDPRVFEEPDKLDVGRGGRQHVAFGFGPHQCLGQNLARMELQIVIDTLFHRIPTLTLAAHVDELPFKDDATIFGLHRLPVTW